VALASSLSLGLGTAAGHPQGCGHQPQQLFTPTPAPRVRCSPGAAPQVALGEQSIPMALQSIPGPRQHLGGWKSESMGGITSQCAPVQPSCSTPGFPNTADLKRHPSSPLHRRRRLASPSQTPERGSSRDGPIPRPLQGPLGAPDPGGCSASTAAKLSDSSFPCRPRHTHPTKLLQARQCSWGRNGFPKPKFPSLRCPEPQLAPCRPDTPRYPPILSFPAFAPSLGSGPRRAPSQSAGGLGSSARLLGQPTSWGRR